MVKRIKQMLAWVVTFIMMFSVIPIMQPIVVEAETGEYVTLAEVDQKTSTYKLPENVGDSFTLTVACEGNTSGMHFYAEILDITDEVTKKYFTTVSQNIEAWYYNCEGEWDYTLGTGLSAAVAGNVYEVTYIRGENNTISVAYSNYTTGQTLATYHARNTGFDPAYTCARIKNRGGKFRVYVGTAEENGFSANNNTIAVPITNHGVDRTKIYTEDDISDTIPEGYDITESTQGSAKKGEYNKYFLKEDLQTVKITIDENNLNYLLQNAVEEPYVLAESTTIGDTTIKYAGLKTKGNVSLSSAFNDTESDRFSFTVNFGKFVKKKKGYTDTQNFYGCSKVSFNAMASDSTMMHEYNAFRLMDEMGLPTPAYGMAKLYINDQYYGPYFMVEAIDTNILKRYQGSSDDITDYFVKPNYTSPYYLDVFDSYKDANGEFTMESLQSILYENEDGDWEVAEPLTQISGMWENDSDTLQDVAEMIPTMLNWEYKLTCLSKGLDYERNEIDVNSAEYMSHVEELFGDADLALRYFATHSFIIQMDNLFTWRQNYALHIGESGKATIVPWDYDLAWGNLGEPNTPEEIANWDYDVMYNDVNTWYNIPPSSYSPEEYYKSFQGIDGYNIGTPLFNVFFQNDAFRKKYHQYMGDCSKIASLGGTTTDGKTYEAGRFYSTMMEDLYEKMVTASGEKLADNVYYMNGFQHPARISSDMPKLAELISQRAVGVWLQVNEIDSKVCAGETSGGNLTIVDAATGIFAQASYSENGTYPALSVDVRENTSNVQEIIGADELEGKKLSVYKLTDTKNPAQGYTVYLSVVDSDAKIYTYNGTELTELQTTTYGEDSILSVKVANLNNDIVVVDGVSESEDGPEEPPAIVPLNATIQKDSNVASVDLYYTSTYGATPDETNISTASARDSKTGEIDASGDGQINIRINVKEGYEIDSITVTPENNYKNLKGPDETNAENVYRITKIKGDIVVNITTKKIATEDDENQNGGNSQTPEGDSSQDNTSGQTGNQSGNQSGGQSGGQSGNSSTRNDTGEKTEPSVDTGLEKGDVVTAGKIKFKVTGDSTVEFISPKTKTQQTITIPATVVIGKKSYKVTSIAANAFKNNKKLKKVVIGKNITKIGKNAFYNCKKLKTVIVKTTKLTAKKIGSNAFKGTPKKAVMKAPRKKLKLYKKIFKKKGFKGKIK